MSKNQATSRIPTRRRNRLRATALAVILSLGGAAPCASAADTSGAGTISGAVSNITTGNLLEGAKVELPALGRSTFVDRTGRYVLDGVPAGTHEIVASYSGLDTLKLTVTVAAGQRAVRDFDLTSGVYMLDPFKVAGEKEGLAAAITQQRNADNLKNVVSMDAYGNLPNLNATELAIRLPGVTFADPGDEVVEQISVRGMGAGMSVITIDGGLMSSFSAQNRTTRMTAFTGAMFESLELIKGHTPDKGADSLGGTVNFKTRSPLSMREKRRLSYTLSAGHAASFTEQVPLREMRRTHPLINVAYQEKFKMFGSEDENLAVSVNLFYSENAFGFFRTQRDFQQTANVPAYLWDYRTTDNYNNRVQRSINTKFDYRFSRSTLFRMNFIVNNAPEPMRRQYQTRAFAGSQTTVPSATSGVVPGFTDRITVVRANAPAATANPGTTPTAAIDVTSTLINRDQRLRHFDISGEHIFRRFEFDWASQWSRTRYRTLGAEGSLVNRIGGVPFIGPNGLTGSGTNTIVGPGGERGVGWILDRTQSDLYPRFSQNGGLDFTNPNNYRPTQNGLASNSGDLNQHLVRDLRGNIKYKLPIEQFTAFLKTGGQAREQTVSNWNIGRHRWSYIGRDALPTDPSILLWDKVKTGRNIPTWEGAQFIQNGRPTNPALWQEDRYFHEQNKYTGFSRVQETVTAGYVMTQGRVGHNGFLAGVRGEKTDTVASSFVRNRVNSTAAQQTADPEGTARRDYANNYRTRDGSYTKFFPSIHLNRNFTANLKGRISWSTSFGRPSMTNALPTETINETAQTLTIGNPALLPQSAKNWDVTAEYYFEPSGSLTFGWFHKTIRDYIVSGREVGTIGTGPDNGYNGEYPGFTELTNRNAGTAIAQGWEFAYVQQFRFLPGMLKGLSLNTNLTMINTHGNFGGSAYRGNGQVQGFIPLTYNVSLSWNHRRFGTRILYNFTDEHIRTYNETQSARNVYMMARELVNLGLTYQVRPNLKLQLDIANLFNEPQKYYRSIPDQLERFLMQGTKITAGVQGQF
ncbi:MAG: TonB-dependent receptor [Verrucomicrobia bacterium]|nr:TonB-dependent receptor [Verrucomicrobiota bacterium]